MRASALQIYNETCSDLLRPERTNLPVRESAKKGIFVEGLSEWGVRSPEEVDELMEMARKSRATAETKLNETSSRSHSIFRIVLEQHIIEGGEFKVSTLNLGKF